MRKLLELDARSNPKCMFSNPPAQPGDTWYSSYTASVRHPMYYKRMQSKLEANQVHTQLARPQRPVCTCPPQSLAESHQP